MNPLEERKLLEPQPLFHRLYKKLPPIPQEEESVLVNRKLPPLPQQEEHVLFIYIIPHLPQEEEGMLSTPSTTTLQHPEGRWTRWLQRLQLSRMLLDGTTKVRQPSYGVNVACQARPVVLRSDNGRV